MDLGDTSATHGQVVELIAEARFRGLDPEDIRTLCAQHMGRANPYHLTRKGVFTFLSMVKENGVDWARELQRERIASRR
jgi:hypothetical protein